MTTSSVTRYNNLAVILHWAIALLIIGLLILGWFLEDIPKGPLRKELFNLHKSLGLLVLVLFIVRVYWRTRSLIPEHVPGSAHQVQAAKIAHVLIYILMGLVPAIALVAGTFNRGIDFFTWHIDPIFTVNKDLAHLLMEWHGWLAYTLAAFVVLHILAALWHQFFRKDRILRRMWFTRA